MGSNEVWAINGKGGIARRYFRCHPDLVSRQSEPGPNYEAIENLLIHVVLTLENDVTWFVLFWLCESVLIWCRMKLTKMWAHVLYSTHKTLLVHARLNSCYPHVKKFYTVSWNTSYTRGASCVGLPRFRSPQSLIFLEVDGSSPAVDWTDCREWVRPLLQHGNPACSPPTPLGIKPNSQWQDNPIQYDLHRVLHRILVCLTFSVTCRKNCYSPSILQPVVFDNSSMYGCPAAWPCSRYKCGEMEVSPLSCQFKKNTHCMGGLLAALSPNILPCLLCLPRKQSTPYGRGVVFCVGHFSRKGRGVWLTSFLNHSANPSFSTFSLSLSRSCSNLLFS